MKTSVLSLAFLLAPAALAQQAAQQAPQQPAAPAQTSAPYTLRTGTQRVLVDVVVRDKKGTPVHNLKQSDFLVTENGTPQDIRSFDEHTAITAAQAVAAPRLPSLPPGEYTNYLAVKPSSALNIILFDSLNTAQSDQQYVRQKLVEYLKHPRPDARTAIFGLTDHLILLQGFTANPAVLLRAIENKGDPKASPLSDNTLGQGAGIEDLSATTNVLSRYADNDALVASVQAFEAQYQSFQAQLRGKYTLDALNQLGRSLSSVPGRKNLIWFSGSFPTGFFPGDNDPNVPYGQFAGLEDEFQQTIDLLTNAQVAIYPVDARGLRTNINNSAAQANNQYGSVHRSLSRSGLGAATALEQEDSGTAREHIGLDQIAHDTGGQAFYNNNDLTLAVDSAISAGSNYYTLSYAPSNTMKKPDFRSIAVKINGQDYKLSYRRGYYTETLPLNPANTRTQPRTQIAGATPAPPSSMHAALMQGGPEPTEILLRVKAAPADSGGDGSVVNGNSPNPDAKKSKGPYQTFQLDYATSIHAIQIRKTSDSRFHADLDFVAYVYDGNGTLVNAVSNTLRTNYTAQELADAFRAGLPFTQKISVPQDGVHFLRLAVHDNIGDKVGAVEIPVSEVKRLPPVISQVAPSPLPSAGTPQ